MNQTFLEYFGLAAITCVELFVAFVVSLGVDFFVSETEDSHKHTWHILLECCAISAGLMILFTFISKQLHKIETIRIVKKLTEWKEFPLLFVFGFIFCDVLQHKVERLRRRTVLHGTHEKDLD